MKHNLVALADGREYKTVDEMITISRDMLSSEIASAAAAAVREEREACAELAKSMIGATRHEIAAAIRARNGDGRG